MKRANSSRPMSLLTVVRANREVGGLEVSVARLLGELVSRGHRGRIYIEGRRSEGPTAGYFDRTLPGILPGDGGAGGARTSAPVVHLHAAPRTMWSTPRVRAARLRRRPVLLTVPLPSEPQPRPTRLGRVRD